MKGPEMPQRVWGPDSLMLLGAGAALIVAPFLPFLIAVAAFVGQVGRSGIEITGGEAFVLVAAGGALACVGFQRGGGGRRQAVLPLVISLVAAALTYYYFGQIDERIREMNSEDFGVASLGLGMWLAIGGSVLGILGSLARANRTALGTVGSTPSPTAAAVVFPAGPNRGSLCGNCGQKLEPDWEDRCQHCGALFAEYTPFDRAF